MKMNGLVRKLIMMALPFLIKKGTDYVAKRGSGTTDSKQLQNSARASAKRARQAAKITRKMR